MKDNLIRLIAILILFSGCSVEDGVDGIDGFSIGLQTVTQEDGCKELTFFKDSNSNGVLDTGESIIDSFTVCNGSDGQDGEEGDTYSLFIESASIEECSEGGIVIYIFQDLNRNGIFDSSEESVLGQSLICFPLVTQQQALRANGFLKLGDFNSHQYYYKEQEVSFNEARVLANYLSVDLLTITNQEEQEFVLNTLTSKELNNKNWWLGLTREQNEGNWSWLNGEEFSYSNWSPGEPNDLNGEEDYAHLEFSSCTWNDYKSSGRPNNSPIFIIVEF